MAPTDLQLIFSRRGRADDCLRIRVGGERRVTCCPKGELAPLRQTDDEIVEIDPLECVVLSLFRLIAFIGARFEVSQPERPGQPDIMTNDSDDIAERWNEADIALCEFVGNSLLDKVCHLSLGCTACNVDNLVSKPAVAKLALQKVWGEWGGHRQSGLCGRHNRRNIEPGSGVPLVPMDGDPLSLQPSLEDGCDFTSRVVQRIDEVLISRWRAVCEFKGHRSAAIVESELITGLNLDA